MGTENLGQPRGGVSPPETCSAASFEDLVDPVSVECHANASRRQLCLAGTGHSLAVLAVIPFRLFFMGDRPASLYGSPFVVVGVGKRVVSPSTLAGCETNVVVEFD